MCIHTVQSCSLAVAGGVHNKFDESPHTCHHWPVVPHTGTRSPGSCGECGHSGQSRAGEEVRGLTTAERREITLATAYLGPAAALPQLSTPGMDHANISNKKEVSTQKPTNLLREAFNKKTGYFLSFPQLNYQSE